MGLVTSPHTSAGRIPTPRGYRLFVDTMVTVRPLEAMAAREVEKGLLPDSPQRVLNSAAQILSNLTHFAGVVMTPKRAQVFKHIEFLRLGEGKILLIMVTPEGDVQNRILPTTQDYTPSQLIEAGNFINAQFAGKSFDQVRMHLKSDLDNLRTDIAGLMALALQTGVADYDMGRGDMVLSYEDLAVISAPYSVDGQIVGTLGVIGPTRMAYDRVIPIVDITSKLLSGALSS